MRILSEEASAIYIEQPGPEYEGFEFSLEGDAGIEYHQAKRQKTGEGRWTLGALAEAGVLRAFFERLHEADAGCTFVSAHAAGELEELSDRARKADSAEQFTTRYLDSPLWRSHFAQLARIWEAPEEWSWEALRRIQVRTVDEATLTEQVDFEVQMRLAGQSKSASAALVEILRDNVNRRLSAHDLWSLLEKKAGLRANPLSSPGLGTVALKAANERFSRSRQRDRIGGRLIPRQETNALRAALESKRVVMLQGAAGMGKSEVLSELMAGFEEDAVPHLFLRLDRLKASTTAQQVGEQLDLAAPPPVALAAAAAGSECFLVVDQLDAISTTSGRNPEFLDAVEEMLRLALVEPKMKIVLACRSFDASHDSRLRQLFDDQDGQSTITVGPLSEQLVRTTLRELEIDPAALNRELIELCSVPLHLYLMGQISARSAADVLRLKTLNDLYSAFWEDKQSDLREILDRDPSWTEVIDVLVDRMSEEPSLEAPRAMVDAWKRDVDAMLSAAVLVEEDGQLAFFHETFFDYAFARRFNARGCTLHELLANDQLLFRRAQVRQILARGRESSPQGYADDLNFLLSDDSIRFHLKELVLAWLQTVDEPREIEWTLLERLLGGDSAPLADRAWRTLGAPGWFDFLNGRGILASWLADDEERRDRALRILIAAGPENGDRVAELLSPYQQEKDSGTELEAVLHGASLGESRDLFQLLLAEIEGGSELGRRDFWYLAHDLPEHRPSWACELLGAYLRRRMGAGELIVRRGGPLGMTRLDPQGLHLREFITAAASGAPKAFVEEVLPVMFEVIDQTGDRDREGGLRYDRIWGLRHFGDGLGELEDDLLVGAEQALELFAGREPERFRALFAEHEATPFESVVFLLFKGLGANPAEFAEEVIDFLVADPRRLRIGYSDAYHWGTRLLLEKISPHASAAAMARLEERLLGYYTPWEKSVQSAGRQLGLAQFEILGGIAEKHRTSALARRFAELQRKFKRADAWGPHGIQGGVVGSPIDEAKARKMNDANWQRAMERYASENRRDDGDFLKGGANQLASVLETLCGEEPARFARLAKALPDEINTTYFDSILRGVGGGESAVALTDAEELIKRCHNLPGRPCGQWIGHPLRAHLESEVSGEILNILSWYAIEGDGASNVDFGEDAEEQLLSRGLNSVRGGMAYELARLIQAEGSRVKKLEPALRSLCADESTAVRAMAAETLFAVAAHDPECAVELFLELTAGPDDALLATRFVRQFLVVLGAHNFEKLSPLIERMIKSPLEVVRSEGAAQAGLAALTEMKAQPIADACIHGAPELRLGATRVFAHNLRTARYRAVCEKALKERFDDEDSEVRKAAAEAIQRLSPESVGASSALIEDFFQSQAFAEHVETVLFAVEDASAAPPGLALTACERVLAMLESPDDVTKRAARVAHQVSDLLIRAYVDANTPEEKDRALDVIDRALEVNAYGAQRALLEHDRG